MSIFLWKCSNRNDESLKRDRAGIHYFCLLFLTQISLQSLSLKKAFNLKKLVSKSMVSWTSHGLGVAGAETWPESFVLLTRALVVITSLGVKGSAGKYFLPGGFKLVAFDNQWWQVLLLFLSLLRKYTIQYFWNSQKTWSPNHTFNSNCERVPCVVWFFSRGWDALLSMKRCHTWLHTEISNYVSH